MNELKCPSLLPMHQSFPDPVLIHELDRNTNGANIHRVANIKSSYCGLCDLLRALRDKNGDWYSIVMIESDIYFIELKVRAFLLSHRRIR